MAVTEAVILCGGLGTRLRSVVSDRPKCMAEVAGRPFLEWVVEYLRAQGVIRIVFCTGYMAESIQDYFGGGLPWGVECAYSQEIETLGTGGALRLALPQIQSERVLVLNGDTYCQFDINRLEAEREKRDSLVTMFFYRDISAGVYLMDREVIESIPAGRPVSMEKEIFPNISDQSRVRVVFLEFPFLDIGTPDRYAAAEKFLCRTCTEGK